MTALSAQARDRLLVATGDWPPFISAEAEDFGPLSAQVSDIFRGMGYDIEIQVVPWKRAYELTLQGHYPASFAWFWTKKRARELLVPDRPLKAFDHSVFFNRQHFPDGLPEAFNSLSDLVQAGYRVAGVDGYWYVSEFQGLGAQIYTAPGIESVLRLIQAGRYDVFLENRDVGYWVIRNSFGAAAVSQFGATGSIPAGDLYVMFSPAHPMGRRLLDAYNALPDE